MIVVCGVESDVHPWNVDRAGKVPGVVNFGIVVAMGVLKIVRPQQPMQTEGLRQGHQQQKLLPVDQQQQQPKTPDEGDL